MTLIGALAPCLNPGPPLRMTIFAVLTVQGLLAHSAGAQDCTSLGLDARQRAVMQLQEAGFEPRAVVVFQGIGRRSWFLPLQQPPADSPTRAAQGCMHAQVAYWLVQAEDPALRVDPDKDTLTYIDHSQVDRTIEARKLTPSYTSQALTSAGVNYQLTAAYSDVMATNQNGSQRAIRPGVSAELFGYANGWFFANTLAWQQGHRVARYESYALRESPETASYLRLGDAITGATAQGESLPFAGVSWGTDRNLRPNDFAPVLPTLRSGNALASPLEVFINDTLRFQQTLQSGVVDLRNLPALQGFNSYSIRTLDAQGNPVTVQRDIYLPAGLLPPGITAWRIDAGLQRRDFFTSNANYGGFLVQSSYSTGLNHDLTVGGQALVSRRASTASLEADRRLSALWTGHIGLLWGRSSEAVANSLFSTALLPAPRREGQALQARLEGGGRAWRVAAESTYAADPLPSLGNRPSLRRQSLLRAQFTTKAGAALSLTRVQSQREAIGREEITGVSVSSRVSANGAHVSLGMTRTLADNKPQNNVMLALFLPLDSAANQASRALFVSQNHVDGNTLNRAQWTQNGPGSNDSNWGLGATRDGRQFASALDGFWIGQRGPFDLQFNGRVGRSDRSALLGVRSSLLWTEGNLFVTRPLNGAFAMVSTGQSGVQVSFENRPMGATNADGLLLVPGLVPQQINRLSVNPAEWPIDWSANDVRREVIAPRGGGVLVSFRINTGQWAHQFMVTPVDSNGKPYRGGTVAEAVDITSDERRETVITNDGQLWLGDLSPAVSFIVQVKGQRCRYKLPNSWQAESPAGRTPTSDANRASEPVLRPEHCESFP